MEEQQRLIDASPDEKSLRLEAQVSPVANYAMQQNKIPLIFQLRIVNDTHAIYENAEIDFSFQPEFAYPGNPISVSLPAEGKVTLAIVPVRLNDAYLAALNERVLGRVKITCVYQGQELASQEEEIVVLAFDECYGFHFMPELLACFIAPNQMDIPKILLSASGLLENWTGSPALDAYQSQDSNRVRMQVAAIYGAIQQLNITYAVPPASFELLGQRIRTADVLLRDHLGTCLDLTLLFAACLEAAGLHPLIVVVKGHSFIGVWLEDQSFPETVQDDPSLLTKRIAKGINTICIMETTCACSGESIDFEAAEQAAIRTLSIAPFQYLVDVQRARAAGIRPLPQRILTESGYTVMHEERNADHLTLQPTHMAAIFHMQSLAPDATPTKMDQWQRRLLDLSKRNALINLRLTRSMLPVLTHQLDRLEDAMSSGEDFRILPKPAEWEMALSDEALYESTASLSAMSKTLALDFLSKHLRIPYTEAEVQKSVVHLYRSSKAAMEENGANTLYLALGALKWFESPGSVKPRYAPIILLPVDLLRKSAQAGYVIRLRDDEPQMNITLLEFLKQDFGITVNGLDPLPQDEKGLDIRAILSIMRHHIMHIQRWDVVESAFLGNFSFAQFVMWNDLKNRREDLLTNKIVKSLSDGKLTFAPVDMSQLPLREGNALLPIPADGSQLKAIEAASDGVSFVLHGPPGTGKSQTITNMIANAVAKGKTVLFVAEKMAALSVVQKRLEAIGLGPFSLEMHSNKSRKKDVLDQLERTLKMARQPSRESFALIRAQAEEVRKELERHMRSMHTPYPFGLSLYDAVSSYQCYQNAPGGIHIAQEDITTLTEEKLKQRERVVDELVAAGRLIGHPKGHPLTGIGVTVYTQQLRGQAEQALAGYTSAMKELEESLDTFKDLSDRQAGSAFQEIRRMAAWAEAAAALYDIPASWLSLPNLIEQLPGLSEYCEHEVKRDQLSTALLKLMDASYLKEDGEVLKRTWRTMQNKWFLPRAISKGKILKSLSGFCNEGKLKKEQAEQVISNLAALQQECASIEAAKKKLSSELTGDSYTPETRKALAQKAALLLLTLRNICETDAVHIQKTAGKLPQFIPSAQKLQEKWNCFISCEKVVRDVLWPKPDCLFESQSLKARMELVSCFSSHLSLLRDYSAWLSTAKRAGEAGLTAVVSAYEQGLDHENVKHAYFRGQYRAMVEWIFARDPQANEFNGTLFEEKVTQFRLMDKHLTELTRQEITNRLAARIPNINTLANQSSELGILQRAIRSGGRGIAIRKLMEQLPTLLPLLCPCMLMSPLSAAQYLDPKRDPFDLVVFDEASQLPTCKAIGVLARGKDSVVVGDPKQMPPTSFFSTGSADEENLELEDLESILDDCLALSMPQTHLKWHYRSRHESLIAFSNREYYENELYTFPSPNALCSKVTYIPAGGYYDRGKTRQNRAEAEAIVAEVLRRLQTQNQPSIGIVTFSAAQQNLIDDLLLEEFVRSPHLEENALKQDEPLFIKNLENVQGDERDVILFSIGYGPDEAGQVAMNFGPLNREGGWRRLNVAVSRAREEMMVFATLRPDQLDMSRTRSKGVANLKSFLEFAMQGRKKEKTASEQDIADGLAQSIAEALNKVGYTAHLQVGFSKFKVDVAVVDPKNENQYLMGILLDGFSYAAAESVRDRELSQSGVLANLGWRLLRVYAIDWWEDPQRETERIVSQLEKAESQEAEMPPILRAMPLPKPGQSVEVAQLAKMHAMPAAEPVISPKDEACKEYVIAQLPYTPQSADIFVAAPPYREIVRRLGIILQAEAPIVERLLVRRLLQSFGISRAGSRIQALLQNYLKTMICIREKQGDDMVYFLKDVDPSSYFYFRLGEGEISRRDASEIPWVEVSNAVHAVLKAQFGLPREDLIRETAKLLGYARVGTGVYQAMQMGIENLVASSRAKLGTEDRIFLV